MTAHSDGLDIWIEDADRSRLLAALHHADEALSAEGVSHQGKGPQRFRIDLPMPAATYGPEASMRFTRQGGLFLSIRNRAGGSRPVLSIAGYDYEEDSTRSPSGAAFARSVLRQWIPWISAPNSSPAAREEREAHEGRITEVCRALLDGYHPEWTKGHVRAPITEIATGRRLRTSLSSWSQGDMRFYCHPDERPGSHPHAMTQELAGFFDGMSRPHLIVRAHSRAGRHGPTRLECQIELPRMVAIAPQGNPIDRMRAAGRLPSGCALVRADQILAKTT